MTLERHIEVLEQVLPSLAGTYQGERFKELIEFLKELKKYREQDR